MRVIAAASLALALAGCSIHQPIALGDPELVPPNARLRGTLRVSVALPVPDIAHTAMMSPYTWVADLGSGAEPAIAHELEGIAERVQVIGVPGAIPEPDFDGYDRALLIDEISGQASIQPGLQGSTLVWVSGRIRVKDRPSGEPFRLGGSSSASSVGPAVSEALRQALGHVVKRLREEQ